jgi:hypothetical protein
MNLKIKFGYSHGMTLHIFIELEKDDKYVDKFVNGKIRYSYPYFDFETKYLCICDDEFANGKIILDFNDASAHFLKKDYIYINLKKSYLCLQDDKEEIKREVLDYITPYIITYFENIVSISEKKDEYESKIKYDGIYYFDDYYICDYFRFYEDGTIKQFKKGGFNKKHENISICNYSITGNEISFQRKIDESIVDYHGYFLYDDLRLTTHNYLNGDITIAKYKFKVRRGKVCYPEDPFGNPPVLPGD